MANDQPGPPIEPGVAGGELERRVDELATEVAGLRDQIVDLRASLDALRRSLGE